MNDQGTKYHGRLKLILKRIRDWNINAGLTNFDFKLECDMLDEEIHETREALNNFDRVEIADGLCDIIFVLVGTNMKSKSLKLITPSVAVIDSMLEVELKPSLRSFLTSLVGEDMMNDHRVAYQSLMMQTVGKYGREKTLLLLEEVCKSNESKIPFEVGPTGKLRKGPNFIAPDIAPILDLK